MNTSEHKVGDLVAARANGSGYEYALGIIIAITKDKGSNDIKYEIDWSNGFVNNQSYSETNINTYKQVLDYVIASGR